MKNWYISGLGYHTASHIKSVGRICGWKVVGHVVYGSDGGIIGYRKGKAPADLNKRLVVPTELNPVEAMLNS